jgi:hypothetical protein
MPTKCFMLDVVDRESGRVFVDGRNGKEYTYNNLPPGGIFRAPWYNGVFCHPQLDCVFVVILPDGHHWIPDSQASNCTIPDDVTQERHHCWVVHGELPNITVDKAGQTCSAGAGSIQSPDGWHGFLRNGELVL